MRKTYKPIARTEKAAQIYRKKTLAVTDNLNINHDEDDIEDLDEYWQAAQSVIGNRTIDSLDDTVITEQSDTLFNIKNIRKSLKPENNNLGSNKTRNGATDIKLREDKENQGGEFNMDKDFMVISRNKENANNSDLFELDTRATKKNVNNKENLIEEKIKQNFVLKKTVNSQESVDNDEKSRKEAICIEKMNKENTAHENEVKYEKTHTDLNNRTKEYKNKETNESEDKNKAELSKRRLTLKPGDSDDITELNLSNVSDREAPFDAGSFDIEASDETENNIKNKSNETNSSMLKVKQLSRRKTPKTTKKDPHSIVIENTKQAQKKNKVEPLVCTDSLNTAMINLDYMAYIKNERAANSFSLFVMKGKISIKAANTVKQMKNGEATVIEKGQIYSLDCISEKGASLFVSYVL